MEIRFRLAEILDRCGEPRFGLIKRICGKTQLERHQVAGLLNNTMKRMPVKVLEAVCNYLVKEHRMDPERLPGDLFTLEESEFWSMLGDREHIEISFGMRRGGPGPERRWVMAPDSILHGALLQELSGVGYGRPSRQLRSLVQRLETAPDSSLHEALLQELSGVGYGRPSRQRRSLVQRLVTAPDSDEDMASDDKMQELIDGALKIYTEFNQLRGGKAHICVGSIKSNFMVEAVMAKIFGEEAFVSRDQIKKAMDRRCPVYYHYRSRDPKPPSCHGGVRLSKEKRKATPGIWYETSGNVWRCCPSDETHDAALVAYAFRPSTGRLDMVMGGYSGRATESLAEFLSSLGREFWPPSYIQPNLKLGVFVVKFEYEKPTPNRDKAGNVILGRTVSKRKVIGIDREVSRKRFDKNYNSEEKSEEKSEELKR